MLVQENKQSFNDLVEVISKAIAVGLVQSGMFPVNNTEQQSNEGNEGNDRNALDWQLSQNNFEAEQAGINLDYSNQNNLEDIDDKYHDYYDQNYQLEEQSDYNHDLLLDTTNELQPSSDEDNTEEDNSETDNRSASQIAGRIYGSEWVVMQNELLYAISNLTADERKLIMYLSPLVRREIDKNPEQNTFNVVASDFASFYDMEVRHVYKKLEEISKSMINKSFFLWNFYKNEKQGLGGKDGGDMRGISWLGEAGYRKNRGVLEVELTSTMIGMLTVFDKLHPYTKYQRSLITNLTHYGLILFELIMSCMYQKFKKKKFTIDYLREKFNCVDSYSKIAEFKRNVLDNAIENINSLGVITVSYTHAKTGRAITHIIFSFTDNSKGALEGVEEPQVVEIDNDSNVQSIENNNPPLSNAPVFKEAKPTPTPAHIKGDLFKSENQRREFSERLSQLKQLAHMATGETNTYEAFANKIYEDLKDVSKQGFYKPFLDMVQFNATNDDYHK